MIPDAAPFDPPPVCPECGYALVGLPATGRCPECGWGWAQEAVVYAAPDPAWRMMYRAEGTCGALAVLAGVLAALNFTGSRWVLTAGFAGAGLFWLYLLLARLWLRWGGPPVEQARFGPRGFARRIGFGPVRWRPWEAGHAVALSGRAIDEDFPVQRLRLRIVNPARRFPALRKQGLEMFFNAPPADAAALVDRLVGWRDAACRPRLRN